MKRLMTGLFVAALFAAPAAFAHDHGHGWGHDKHAKHEWKAWKHAHKHGYYAEPVVVTQPAPVIVQQPVYVQPQPVVYYQPEPAVNVNFRIPLR